MLSHRRQSVPQSEAVPVPPFSSSPYLVPLPSTPLQHPSLSSFKLPSTIDDSSAIYEEDVDGVPVEAVKEHTDLRTVADFVPCSFSPVADKSSGAVTMAPDQIPEFRNMLELLRKCLDLRDKYIAISNQRLGDNPRDHDGVFHGIAEGISDVMGVRPEATGSYEPMKEQFKPWRIYPRPPPPHWHWTADHAVSSGRDSPGDVFDFTQLEVPGAHEWGFEIDDKGIYQVYHDVSGTSFLFA